MKVIIQRVKKANCIIDNAIFSEIGFGYVLFVGLEKQDTLLEVEKCVNKLIKLRILEDEQGKMNLSLMDRVCEVLSISQFTIAGNLKKGNRPSFDTCLEPSIAKAYYEKFNQLLQAQNIVVKTGSFGANMTINLANDGPTTFIIDSKELS